MDTPAARRRLALSLGIGLACIGALVIPLRSAPQPQLSLISTLVAGNVMTAYLLIMHAIQRRSAATTLLACAYVVTIVTYNVAPAILERLHLANDAAGTAIAFVAHVGFASCFALFALVSRRPRATMRSDRTFALRIISLIAGAALASVIAAVIMARVCAFSLAFAQAAPAFVAPYGLLGLAVFLVRTRPTVSNTWLALALWASTLDAAMLAISPPASLGIFAAEAFGLISCILIPTVYLIEFNGQYAWLARSNALFRRQALTDELTELGNRRYYDARVESLFASMRQSGSGTFAILAIDIDRFKAYNDTFGHIMGDECLRRTSKALRAALYRTEDEAMRYGGEEFVVVLPGTGYDGATMIADRIRKHVYELAIMHQTEHSDRVTVSIGVAVAPYDGATPDQLFASADAALYRAKDAGRNATVRFASS